jgi:cation-transporting ATPase 13A1
LQQQQVMMMNAIINAFVLSVISLEGSRRSERQLIASDWLITTASLAFSYASPCDRMHPIRPLRSLFHPAIFLSMLGQAIIHLGCLHFAVTMAREVMAEESVARSQGWEGPGLADIKEFWRRQKLIRRGLIAKEQEEEEKPFTDQLLDMWLSPFLPNLMNTVVFLVETAQTVAVLMVNYKGQPWMKGLLENRPLFFSAFVVAGAIVAAAWEFSPEANALLHLSPFPSDAFRWKVMGLVTCTLFGSFFWDRFCLAVFGRENFRATLEAASKTTFKNDVVPLLRTAMKVIAGFSLLFVLGASSAQRQNVAIPITADI